MPKICEKCGKECLTQEEMDNMANETPEPIGVEASPLRITKVKPKKA
jgi:hypothetical protein